MNVETAKYKQDTIRYTIVADNGILLNTGDVRRVLGINGRPADGKFCEPCIDIAGVIEAALSNGKDDIEFVDWLEANFVGYEIRTPIRPNCDDDWKVE